MNLTEQEFLLFQKYIQDQCGIQIGKEKSYLIESRLTKLLIDSGLTSFEQLYLKLAHTQDEQVRDRVIDALTTNETSWFRDRTPWHLFKTQLMPKFVEQLRSGARQRIRIWSAAASTGQEAYSIAMSIDRYLQDRMIRDVHLQQFEILATDISQTVLEMARRGRYDSISIMRGLPEEDKRRYFRQTGMAWEIDERLKSMVRFERFNLQNSFVRFGVFDSVFCRYVLIYFSDELKAEIIDKLSRCMVADGVLFIGASELNPLLDQKFMLRQSAEGSYYTKRGG